METKDAAVLVAAAAAGSLSAAARRLGITPLTATRRLASLEQELGVRLMHRTTRSLSLTPEGEVFLPYAQALVEQEEAGLALLRSTKAGASGLLRVTAPASFGRKIVAPLVPEILSANPQLRIDLELTDNVVDIVGSGLDLAIRIAKLRDSNLIARRLADSPRVFCAAPSYLRERGRPRNAADLASHEGIAVTGVTHWTLRIAGETHRVAIPKRFSCSNIDGIYEACVAGAGIALIAEWNARKDLASGALEALPLEDAEPEELAIWAVYPTVKQILPKLSVFVMALEEALKRV